MNKLLKSFPDLPSWAEIQLLSHWQNFDPSSCLSYTYLIAGRGQPSSFLLSWSSLYLVCDFLGWVICLHDHMQLTGWGNARSYLSSWVPGSLSSGGLGNFSWMAPFVILIRPSALCVGHMGHELMSPSSARDPGCQISVCKLHLRG